MFIHILQRVANSHFLLHYKDILHAQHSEHMTVKYNIQKMTPAQGKLSNVHSLGSIEEDMNKYSLQLEALRTVVNITLRILNKLLYF